jgi:DNA-binding NtrC family response regulator
VKPVQARDLIDRLADHVVLGALTIDEALGTLHKAIIERMLSETHGNQVRASSRLRVHRNTLARQIEQLGIEPKDFR